MSEENLPVDDAGTTHGEHAEIHMPPNSLIPISVAISLCMTLVGFVDQVRGNLGPLIWGIGALWFIASCAAWVRAARNEFHELPEVLEDH
jgi:hypothetical protein